MSNRRGPETYATVIRALNAIPAGQLMTPSRVRKRIKAIEQRVPDRIKPLIMAPAYHALTAAEQVADEFFVPSPNPDAITESRPTHLQNGRRNTTHGWGRLSAASFAGV